MEVVSVEELVFLKLVEKQKFAKTTDEKLSKEIKRNMNSSFTNLSQESMLVEEITSYVEQYSYFLNSQ